MLNLIFYFYSFEIFISDLNNLLALPIVLDNLILSKAIYFLLVSLVSILVNFGSLKIL